MNLRAAPKSIHRFGLVFSLASSPLWADDDRQVDHVLRVEV